MNKHYPSVYDLAIQLLGEFEIANPTLNQIKTAESFILNVIYEGKFYVDQNLSRKEILCLYWAAQGKSTQEIGEILHLAVGTIETYRKRILKKLKVKNMIQAVFTGLKYAHICQDEINYCNSCNLSNCQHAKYPFSGTLFLK